MMTEKQKKQIIESGKTYFRNIIIPNHLRGLQNLKLKDFKVNPFLVNYLAAFLWYGYTPLLPHLCEVASEVPVRSAKFVADKNVGIKDLLCLLFLLQSP